MRLRASVPFQASRQDERQSHVVSNAEPGHERVRLRHEGAGDRTVHLRVVERVVCLFESRRNPDECALAASGGTDDGRYLPLRYRQARTLKRSHVPPRGAVGFRHVSDVDAFGNNAPTPLRPPPGRGQGAPGCHRLHSGYECVEQECHQHEDSGSGKYEVGAK